MTGILKTIGYGCAVSPALLLGNCNQTTVTADKGKPNIILCMADDQGWGDMGYNGHPVLKTPNFDEMARSGLRFDRFYSASPVSSPTRGSVMTGRNPNRFGCFSWGRTLRPQEVTVAEALKKAGYVTGHFGKWHLGPVRKDSPVSPGNSGFDEWLSSPNFFDNDPVLSREGKAVKIFGESSMVTVDAAIEFIRKHSDAKKPFLAVVWFGSPHNPHIAIEEERKQYSGQPENLQHYYGEISGMDRAFGKLRQELQTLGIKENTILWYCSDNGGQSDKYSVTGGRGYKGQVWEGGLRVPAILEWPARIQEPRITNIPCNTYDIYPTLLDITGMSVKDQPPLDGISLASLINNKMKKRKKPMGFWHHTARGIPVASDKLMAELLDEQEKGIEIADTSLLASNAGKINTRYDEESYPGHAAWLDWPYKLHRINLKNEKVRFELYNLEEDPLEKNDIYAVDPSRSEKMEQQIELWLKSVVSSLNGDDYK